MLSRLAVFAGCARGGRRGDDFDAGTQRARAGPDHLSKAIGPFSPSRRPAPHFDATYYAGGKGHHHQRREGSTPGERACGRDCGALLEPHD